MVIYPVPQGEKPWDPIPSRPQPIDLAADVYTLEKQQKEKPPNKNPGNGKELLETVSTELQHWEGRQSTGTRIRS